MKKALALIIALVAVALIGFGLWTAFTPEKTVSAKVIVNGTTVALPVGYPETTGAPILSMGAEHESSKTNEYLHVFANRVALVSEEYKDQGVRIWKSAYLSEADLLTSKAGSLNNEYAYEGYGEPNTQLDYGDMDIVLTISYQGINKTVKAANYLSKYSNISAGTYAGMPVPLAEICQKVNTIMSGTTEVYRENIK
jgi:hypothetical protein